MKKQCNVFFSNRRIPVFLYERISVNYISITVIPFEFGNICGIVQGKNDFVLLAGCVGANIVVCHRPFNLYNLAERSFAREGWFGCYA